MAPAPGDAVTLPELALFVLATAPAAMVFGFVVGVRSARSLRNRELGDALALARTVALELEVRHGRAWRRQYPQTRAAVAELERYVTGELGEDPADGL